MRIFFVILSLFCLSSCQRDLRPIKAPPVLSDLEIVAELPINPGNVTVCPSGQVFATIHQFRLAPARLIEIDSIDSYSPFPSESWNGEFGSSKRVLNSPLGIQCDARNWVWVIDNGSGEVNQAPKLVAFNAETKKEEFFFSFPKEIAPPGSFVQDLAVDPAGGYVYLADIGGQVSPAIIFLDTTTRKARRFEASETLGSEDVDLKVEGKVLVAPGEPAGGKPARVAVNPITLSADNNTIFFGAMTGTKWYSLPSRVLREELDDTVVAKSIVEVGDKPVSDGASTDKFGNHYFTAVNENAIVALNRAGELETVVSDERLVWPDALAFGDNGWLYIAVNQLNRAAPFNGGVDKGKPPYLIARIQLDTTGVVGR